jgi:hypothetical protein
MPYPLLRLFSLCVLMSACGGGATPERHAGANGSRGATAGETARSNDTALTLLPETKGQPPASASAPAVMAPAETPSGSEDELDEASRREIEHRRFMRLVGGPRSVEDISD